MFSLSPFLKIGTMFPFFQSFANISHFKQFLNILKRERGSIIASLDIFNMRILIISWPWPLLGSSLQMNLLISSFVNSMFARYWSVTGIVDEERTLIFNNWALFCKKRIKEIGFFTKISSKFVMMKNRRYTRNVFVI